MGEGANNRLSALFFVGDHREVAARTIDSPTPSYTLEEFPFVVGALVMLGRVEEAETAYLLRARQLSGDLKTACRFFLAIGYCRHSYYEKSLKYLVENARGRREATDPTSRFYRFQGLGFYRYYAGRMKKALKLARYSFDAALEAEFLYGRAFAADLKGHSLVQTGEIGRGLQTLELAAHLAGQLGARWLREAIESSVLTYRVRYGIEGANGMDRLSERLKVLSKQDIFTQSTLLLEVSQALIRRGELTRAKEALNDCCRIVYGSQNRRHAALLNLRYAHIHFLEGEPHLAANLVRNALSQIDPRVDIQIELKLRGLERRLVHHLKIETCMKALDERVGRLTKEVGEATSFRMLAREKDPEGVFARYDEDPLGDLWDLARRKGIEAAEEVLKSGYRGLLAEILPVPRGARAIYLDLEPGSLTIFDRGNVIHFPDQLSRSLRSLLVELQKGTMTKEDLIQRVWKYEYHPLRHDALIYSAMAKLRKVLGARSHWIEASESGYQLRPEVSVIAHPREPRASVAVASSVAPESPSDLNFRQQKILRFLDENEFIDTATCRSIFQMSEVTASRDLSDLVRLSLLDRVGKGRATKYVRKASLSNHNYETRSVP